MKTTNLSQIMRTAWQFFRITGESFSVCLKRAWSNNNESRPELFEFNSNKGKTVSLILKNENVRTGKLLCICPDDAIILDVPCDMGVALCEIPLFDVSDIIVLDN